MKGCKVWLIVVISLCVFGIVFIISGTQTILTNSKKTAFSIDIKKAAAGGDVAVLSTKQNRKYNNSMSEILHLDSKQRVNAINDHLNNVEKQYNLHTPMPVPALQTATKITTLTLISENKPVKSDVRGNLGPASCITNENISDWLQDRWQAAKNMKGEPIPGEHWVEIDLQAEYRIEKFLIDWEVAFSKHWTIQIKSSTTVDNAEYRVLCTSADIVRSERPNKMHIFQHILISTAINRPQLNTARYIRLLIHRPATRYGSSIWRFQVWGRDP